MKKYMPLRRYEVRGQEDGGKYKRFYVWDTSEQRVTKGHLGKFEAVGLEHKLNNRKFKTVE